MKKWYEKVVRVLQFNVEDEEGAYVPVIRGGDVVRLAKEMHANVVVVFARDAWGRAFYDSKIAPKHPRLRGRDFLGELLEEARREGIRVVAMVAHTTNPYLYSKNPDWAQRGVDGGIITMDTDPRNVRREKPHWPLMCLNGPFLEYATRESEEVLNYGVDGVFLDSFRYQPDLKYACFCDRCRGRFKKEMGYELPTREYWEWEYYRRAFLWRYKVNVEAIRKIKERVEAFGKPLIYNSHPGGWGGRFNAVVEEAREYIDIVYAECSETDFQPPGFIAEMVRLTKALNGGKPVWASRNTFHTVLTSAATTAVAVKQGLREAVIAGGSPLSLIFSSAFIQDRRSVEAVAEVYKEVEALEEYLDGAEPVKYAAVVYSNSSVFFFGRKRPEMVIDEARGFYYSLLWRHLPVTYVCDRDLKEGRLDGFKVLILGNVACMSREAARSVEKFAERGGIVATFMTSTMDELGNPLEDFALTDTLGVEYDGRLEFPWSYVKVLRRHAVVEGLADGSLVLWGDFDKDFVDRRVPPMLAWHARVRAGEESEAIASIVAPRAEYGNEYNNGRSPPVAGAELDSPAITVSGVEGRGAVYFSGQLGRLIWHVGLPDYISLAVNSVVWAGGKPPVRGSPPETYELSAFVQGERLVIHLLNYTYNQRIPVAGLASLSEKPMFGSEKSIHPPREVIPLAGIKVYVDLEQLGIERPAKAYSALTGEKFEVEGRGECVVTIPVLREYEVVVLEPG